MMIRELDPRRGTTLAWAEIIRRNADAAGRRRIKRPEPEKSNYICWISPSCVEYYAFRNTRNGIKSCLVSVLCYERAKYNKYHVC